MLAGVAVTLGAADDARGQMRASLVPEASVDVRYDDNVDRTERNRRDDLIATPRAGLSLRARSQRLEASARYRMGVSYFLNDTQEDGDLDHDASLSAALQATRDLTLRVGDGFQVSDTRRIDAEAALPVSPDAPPPAAPAGSIPTRRVRETTNTATVGLDWQVGRHTSLDAGYAYELRRYDDAALIDNDTHRASGRLERQLTEHDRLGVEYEATFYTFGQNGPADRSAHEPSLQWRRALAPSWRGTARAGVTFIDAAARGTRFSDVTGSIGVTGESGPARYRFGYDRSVTTSGGTGELDLTDRVLVGMTRDISYRLTGDIGLAFARNEAIDGRSSPTETYSITGRLTARLADSWTASLGYSFERSDAPPEFASYRLNTLTAVVAWVLPGHGRAGF